VVHDTLGVGSAEEQRPTEPAGYKGQRRPLEPATTEHEVPLWRTGKNLIATLTSVIISHPDTAVAPALSWAEFPAKGAFKATEILSHRHTLLQDTVSRPVGDWALGIPTVNGKVMVDGSISSLSTGWISSS
jgi:hypothetical protein